MLDRRVTRKWRRRDIAMQPGAILVGGSERGIDLGQIGCQPLLARAEPEPRTLA